MAVKTSVKKQRPLRTLAILFIVLIAMYSTIGFNVAQFYLEHQSATTAADSQDNADDSSTNDSSDDHNSDDSSAGDAATADSSSDSETTDQATPEGDNSSDSSQTDGTTDENADLKSPVSFIPKFALDLAGGTELILKAVTEDGSTPDDNALDRAIEVIRQRIDASGVAEAEISKQGDSNIVVGIPGESPSDETIKLISNAAKMSFRPVIAYGGASAKFYTSALGTASAAQAQTSPDVSKYDKDGDGKIESDEEIQAYLTDINAQDKATFESKIASDKAEGTSKYSTITDEDIKAFDDLDCSKEENRKGGSEGDVAKVLSTCSAEESGGSYAKYMLAPVAVEGDQIERAQAGLKQLQSGKTGTDWVVSLKFKDEGDDQFIAISQQVKVLDQPRNQFAITLDGLVISAPSIQKDVNFVKGNGVEISSGTTGAAETRPWATTLANQLSFGALPMNFEVESKEKVSATLGGEQLEKGLLAGIFGLLLVVLFSLFQYRALGLVTVGSLTVATLFTYGVVLLLSWQIGYRLSLPGIIGFIVSIGITADSFIVYFERIRDELRDGRSIDMAVSRGWQRAKQTILASDTVNVLCAVILYILAVGGVRGFAFTLGLTTFIDLIVVFMFTHPIVILLTKLHFFKFGHPLSGLSAFDLGATNAMLYKARTAKDKKAERKEKLDAKKARKEQAAKARELRGAAKAQKKSQAKESRLHYLEYEALMAKKAELLSAGADIDDIINVTLTDEEREAAIAGKDITKLKKPVLHDTKPPAVDTKVDNSVAPKKTAVKNPAPKKPAAKKSTAAKSTVTKTAKSTSTAKKTSSATKPKSATAKSTTAKSATAKTTTKKATTAKKPATKTTASATTKTVAKKPATKVTAKTTTKKGASK